MQRYNVAEDGSDAYSNEINSYRQVECFRILAFIMHKSVPDRAAITSCIIIITHNNIII